MEKICPEDQDGDRSQPKRPLKTAGTKQRGMILKPEHDKEEPSAVKSFTQEVEDETGARKTETEHSKPGNVGTRAYLGDILERSLQNRQVRKKLSSCQPLSFLTRNKKICTSGLVQRGSRDTSTGQASNSGRRKMALEDSGGKDQEWENSGNRKQEDFGWQEQGTYQGQRRYGFGQRRLGFDRSLLHGGPKIGGPWSWHEPSVP